MILDTQQQFSDAQAITSDAMSENVIDLGVATRLGPGKEVPLLVQVVEDFATLTSLQVALMTGDDPATVILTGETLGQSSVVPVAQLVAGYRFDLTWVGTVPSKHRYLALFYNVTGGPATAGKVTAGIVAGLQEDGR